MELEDLYNQRRSLENQIEDFFGDDDCGHTGDQGYQDLLGDLSDVEEEIEELEIKINKNK